MKNILQKTFAIFIIALIITNCVKEEVKETTFNDATNINAETVSLEQAKDFFEKGSKRNKSTMYARGACYGKSINGASFKASPNWQSFKQSPIHYTDALLSIVDTDVNRHGNFSSKLYFIKIDEEIKSVIFTVFNKKMDHNGDILEAVVLFNETNGSFIDAFKIEHGAFTKRLVPRKNKVEKAAFFMLQNSNDDFIHEWIWCDGGAGGQLDEVDLGTIQSRNGDSYDDYISIATQNTHNPDRTYSTSTGGGGMNSSALTSGSGAILLNQLRPIDDSIGCPDGFIKNDSGSCINEETVKEYAIRIDISSTPKIKDIKKELKCFDKSKQAKLTIYVEQAVKNSREVTAALGHTFIGIEQSEIRRNLGFYPDNGGAANLLANQDSEIHDNSGSPYHVSITVNISSSQLSSIIAYIEKYPEKYDLNNYNCSDFGIEIAKRGGLILPKTIGEKKQFGITLFKGRNPGDLGEDIRKLTLTNGATRNLTGGKAPSKSGTCP
ncbi:hypothetical protein MHTCC0001_17800 [Flavobacteriaceae bacterium MHTCC 0001]